MVTDITYVKNFREVRLKARGREERSRFLFLKRWGFVHDSYHFGIRLPIREAIFDNLEIETPGVSTLTKNTPRATKNLYGY